MIHIEDREEGSDKLSGDNVLNLNLVEKITIEKLKKLL